SGTGDGIVRTVKDTPVDLGNAVHDFYHHKSEVRVDRIVGIETAQRWDRVSSLRLHMSLSQEEFRQIRRDRDDARGRLRRTMTNTRSGMTHAAIEEMINQRVNAALEAHQVNQNLALGNNNGNGNGNGNGGVNGKGMTMEMVMEMDFMKCQPTVLKERKEWLCTNLVKLSQETAYALSWGELMILMTEVYCPRNEIQKMETEPVESA
ncbi:hypothetical protein Tco_0332445, partial [Tanacetum coccineum]